MSASHAGTVFGVALLVSGVASSCVGTMSGQVVMEGFLHRRIPVFLRRAVTMMPAVVVLALGFSPTRALVLSQVFLSFGIPFALIPLVAFTASRKVMGSLVNRRAHQYRGGRGHHGHRGAERLPAGHVLSAVKRTPVIPGTLSHRKQSCWRPSPCCRRDGGIYYATGVSNRVCRNSYADRAAIVSPDEFFGWAD